MRFNDHIRDYLKGSEAYDEAAALLRLRGLIQCMLALRYGRGFMSAVRNVCAEVRKMCRASEQRWVKRPTETTRLKRTRKTLSDKEIYHRERMKLCAKAAAHPNIVRDPCRLDAEGLFRLVPIARQGKQATKNPQIITHEYSYDPRPIYQIKGFSSPITIWPDEFQAFEDYEEDTEGESQKLEAPLKRASHEKRVSHDAFTLTIDPLINIPVKVPIPVPP